MVSSELGAALVAGPPRRLRRALRLHVEIANARLVDETAMLAVLSRVLARGAADAKQASVLQVASVTEAVAAALPFFAPARAAAAPDALDALVGALRTQVERVEAEGPRAGFAFDMMPSRAGEDDASALKDDLAQAWAVVDQMHRSQAWGNKAAVQPFADAALADELESGARAELRAEIDALPAGLPGRWPPRRGRLEIAGEVALGTPEASAFTDADRFVIRQLLRDVLQVESLSHKDAAHVLVQLRAPFYASLLFETVVDEMLRLPKPTVPPVFHAMVLADLCQMSEGAGDEKKMRLTIERGVRLLVHSYLERLDFELVLRLADAVSLMVANINWTWDWTVIAPQPADRTSVRFVFAREAVERATRMSYHARIEQVLPEAMRFLLGDKPVPNCPFVPAGEGADSVERSNDNERAIFQAAGRIMTEKHTDSQALMTWYAERGLPLLPDAPAKVAEIMTHAMLLSGSKTFSHTFTRLQRFAPVFKFLMEREDVGATTFLTWVGEFWSRSAQHVTLIVHRCMVYRIVQPKQVIEWLASPWCMQRISSGFVAELFGMMLRGYFDGLRGAEDHVKQNSNTIQRLRAELDNPSNTASAADRASMELTLSKLPGAIDGDRAFITSQRDGQADLFAAFCRGLLGSLALVKEEASASATVAQQAAAGILAAGMRNYYEHVAQIMAAVLADVTADSASALGRSATALQFAVRRQLEEQASLARAEADEQTRSMAGAAPMM